MSDSCTVEEFLDLTDTELGYEFSATSGKLLNHVMILDQLQITTHTFN
jgi:hypothetical protein